MADISIYENGISEKYKKFSSSLCPGGEVFPRLGVPIPYIDNLAKTVDRRKTVPFSYHEDVILYGFSLGKDKMGFSQKLDELEFLLPYFSSWDQTDTVSSRFKVNKKDKDDMFTYFSSLTERKETYIRRFGIIWLLGNRNHFDKHKVISLIVRADNSEYYIQMAVAWSLATFYVDSPDEFYTYFDMVSAQTRKLALRKVRESRRYKGGLAE